MPKVKSVTVKELYRWYRRINREFYNDSLPKEIRIKIVDRVDSRDIAVAETSRWTGLEGGLSHYEMIFEKAAAKNYPRYIQIVMMHECAHLAAGLHEAHNEEFEKNITRMWKLGGYKGLL